MTPKPSISTISARPGPDVAVADLFPAYPAPIAAAIADISSSVCKNLPPTGGISTARRSIMLVAGVIGYPK